MGSAKTIACRFELDLLDAVPAPRARCAAATPAHQARHPPCARPVRVLHALPSFVCDAVWNVTRGDMLCRGLDMSPLVVEKDVRAERPQELALVESAEKERLVDADVPRPKRADHPFVRRGAARRDERGAYRTVILGKVGLDSMQCREKVLERSSRKRRRCRITLAFGEGRKSRGS